MKVARSILSIISFATIATALSACGHHNGTDSSSLLSPDSTASVAAQPGESSLISMNRVTTGLNGCESGSGLQIFSGLDENRSGVLDNSEIQQTQILCDGRDGATGAAGAAGSNGHSLVFSVTTASLTACPTGGSTVVMATDSNDSGTYDVTDANQQSMTLCNGATGSTGATGAIGATGAAGAAAQTPAYTPVTAIMPCGNNVAYKEVLLRLSSGEVLSSFSDNSSGSMTRLTFLPDGTYQDTDDSACTFSLSTSGSSRSISWLGQVQQTWTMNQ